MTPAAKKSVATLPGPDTPQDAAPVHPDDTTVPHIGTHQLRQMHALLRNHGITTDTAVHDYLSVHLDRDLASRKDITAVEAARLISDLETAPVLAGPESLKALRAPFPTEAVGKLPRSTCRDCSQSQRKRCDNPQHTWVNKCRECGNNHSSATMHIDFVGHADVTARLLEVDPYWTWEPMAQDPTGLPVLDRVGGLWIRLTVAGVTRPGYGDSENGKGMKEALGDALRNAAMRFGVALELWAKGDREWAHTEKDGAEQMHPDTAAPRQNTSHPQPSADGLWRGQPDPYLDMGTPDLLLALDELAGVAGRTYHQMTQKLRDQEGIEFDDLDDIPADVVRPYVTNIRAYLESQGSLP